MQTRVSFTREGDVGYLTLACEEPGKPATLDLVVLEELDGLLDKIEGCADELRAVMVQSDSEKYFVVGANVSALEGLNAETIVPWVQKGHEVFARLEDLPVPVIAIVKGFALGGGLELAMACDLIVASSSARFGQPEAKLGFVPGWGGSYRLPRRVGVGRARELFFTGRIIDAEEAGRYGLADFVGEGEALDECISGWIKGICEGSSVAVRQVKKLLRESLEIAREESCEQEGDSSRVCMEEGDTLERVRIFLESRKKR